MERDWRSGFGVGGDRVWVAPLVALSLVAVGQATDLDGDRRSGMFPWSPDDAVREALRAG